MKRRFVAEYASRLRQDNLPKIIERFGNGNLNVIESAHFREPNFRKEYLDFPFRVFETREEYEQFLVMNGYKHFARAAAQKIQHGSHSRSLTDELLVYGDLAEQARNYFVLENMGLAKHLIQTFRWLKRDDALSVSLAAIGRAADKFDCERGFKFSSYAGDAIKKALIRELEIIQRFRRFITGFDVDKLFTERTVIFPDYSIGLVIDEARKIISGEVDIGLTSREVDILRKRFPLIPGTEPKTLEQIGNLIGVTKERTNQIQRRALAKMRAALGG